MAKHLAIDDSFRAVLHEISKEVDKIMADPPEPEDVNAFTAVLNTVRAIAEKDLSYLPKGDMDTLMASYGTWVGIGLMLGRSPGLLADILKRSGATIIS